MLWRGGEKDKMFIEKEDGTAVLLGDRVGVDQFVPVVAIPDLQKRRSQYADVVLVDDVVKDEFIVDQLLDELRPLGFAVVLID